MSDTATATNARTLGGLATTESLNAHKATICDVFCELIDKADSSGTITKDLPLLVGIADLVELLNALKMEADSD